MPGPAPIVILNGAPRSGKSSIARRLMAADEALWVNLGVDAMMAATSPRFQPAIGLRPGGERPDLEPAIPRLYAALFGSIAAHSREGIRVVSDLGIHDNYSRPLGLLADCARRLAGLPVLLVGVDCPLDEIMARRRAGQPGREGQYLTGSEVEPVPAPVARWQEAVHVPGLYDLRVDTSTLDPDQAVALIQAALANPPSPTALARIAKLPSSAG
jgi:chloramphenicol 3-O phosphotransferase